MNKHIESINENNEVNNIEADNNIKFDETEKETPKDKFKNSVEKLEEKSIDSQPKTFSNKFQSIAEKTSTVISILDTIISPFNNYVENFIQPEIEPISVGQLEKACGYAESSYEDLLLEKGYTTKDKPKVTVENVIAAIGGDEDAALKSPEEIKESIKENIEGLTEEKNKPKAEGFPPDL